VLPLTTRCSGWASSSLISPGRDGLCRYCCRVGLHIDLFEDCLAFTRVAACTLARSSMRNLLHRRLQPFRYLRDCSGCYRLARLPGRGSRPLERADFSRRTRHAVIADRILASSQCLHMAQPFRFAYGSFGTDSGPSLATPADPNFVQLRSARPRLGKVSRTKSVLGIGLGRWCTLGRSERPRGEPPAIPSVRPQRKGPPPVTCVIQGRPCENAVGHMEITSTRAGRTAAMPHARIRCGERSALCEPAIPPRRLIRRDRRGKLHRRLANATEPLKQTRL
jgi:hypothetical protein